MSDASPPQDEADERMQRQIEEEIEREIAEAAAATAVPPAAPAPAPAPAAAAGGESEGSSLGGVTSHFETVSGTSTMPVALFDPFAEFDRHVSSESTIAPSQASEATPEVASVSSHLQDHEVAHHHDPVVAPEAEPARSSAAAAADDEVAMQRRIEEEIQRRVAEEQRKQEEAAAVEREVKRRLAEQQAKAEEEHRKAVERETQQKIKQAEEAARVASEQQARIDAAVAERLRQAKEEAEAKKRQRAAEDEIERRVAEALAKQAAEEQRKRELEEEDAKKKAMEDEIERRIAAAAEARIQAALAAAGVPSTPPPRTGGPVTPERKVEPIPLLPSIDRTTAQEAQVPTTPETFSKQDKKQKDDDSSHPSDTNTESSASFDTDDDDDAQSTAMSDHGMDGKEWCAAVTNDPPIDVSRIASQNGLLSPRDGHDEEAQGNPTTWTAWSLSESPDFVDFEATAAAEMKAKGLTAKDGRRDRLVIHRYDTLRESGRCLAPAGEKPRALNHTSIQLGFFQARQTLVNYNPSGKVALADREMPLERLREQVHTHIPSELKVAAPRSLSSSTFFFEADIIKDPAVSADEDEEEDYPHNTHDERLVAADDVMTSPRKAVVAATSCYAVGDPIQLFERARGRRFEPLKPGAALSASNTPSSPVPPSAMTISTGPTAGKVWVQDIETKKPNPAVPMFTGGALLKFDVKSIRSQVDSLHGEGTDPLFFSAGVYCIHTTQTVNVSDTFYFDSHAFTFLPHKQPTNTYKSFVAFIPNEFKSVPLFLCIRAYRLACEEQDNYVDLYSRPDRYKQHHVVPMKQDAQQLAMFSEIVEELGWTMMPLNEASKWSVGSLKTDKIFRGAKSISDAEMMKLVMDHRVRNALRTIQMEIQIDMSDITSNEFRFPIPEHVQDPCQNECLVEYVDPDVPNAKREVARFAACCLPILNAGHFHHYHSVLYLRLQTLRLINLTSVKYPSSTHYSYVVQVALKADDNDLSEEGVPAMFVRWLGDGLLHTSAFSSTYHSAKEFDLGDEFKIQLPLNLTEKHHLFFTIYAVSFKKPTPTTKDPRMVKIGYAAVPVLTKETGSLHLKDTMDLQVISADHAAVASSGYLEKFPTMVNSNMFNNGTYAMKLGVLGRSSVYASNTIVSEYFMKLPKSLESLLHDDQILVTPGLLKNLSQVDGPADAVHMVCLNKVNELPLPEIMAFYPLITGYCLALISAPSASVSCNIRLSALKSLTEFTSKAHGYELSTKSLSSKRSGKGTAALVTPPPGCIRTCTVNLLYHYITNDVLYQSNGIGKMRVFSGLAETLALLLESFTGAIKTETQSLMTRVTDLTWFYLDAILRSLYLYVREHNVPIKSTQSAASARTASSPLLKHSRDDSSAYIDWDAFFDVLQRLVQEILSKLVPIGGAIVIQRTATFIRNLLFIADRGHTLNLMDTMLQQLEAQGVVNHTQTAMKIFMDVDDFVSLCLPSASQRAPSFIVAVLIKYIGPHLINQVREVRLAAANIFYSVLCRLAHNKRVTNEEISYMSVQWISLLHYMSENWALYRSLCDTKGPSVPMAVAADKRPLLAVLMWIVFTAPETEVRHWYRLVDHKTLAGFMFIVTDAQVAFRFNYGKDKWLPDQQKLAPDISEQIGNWDARHATLVSLLGCRVVSNLLIDVRDKLALVKLDKAPPSVFPFFLLLESLLHFGNSTASLQASTAVLHQAVAMLMPEIISRKGRMSSGIVLLTIRMMSGASLHVRNMAAGTFGYISAFYYSLCGSLNKLKHHTANALVAVAESKIRELRLAGAFVERHMQNLMRQAKATGTSTYLPYIGEDARSRYVEDTTDASGDSAAKYNYQVQPQYVSCDTRIAFPAYLTEKRSASATTEVERPSFADDFCSMSTIMLSLFRDVLRLQTDDTMRYKETKALAFADIVHNFLRQNTLKEVFKWLNRLHEAHKASNDYCEAGMVLVYTAALGFRLTEAFYALKGEDCKGARMPHGVLTFVLWHDYVRILPEVNTSIPLANVYAMVSDMTVVPDEPPFTVEGQIKLMKEAAEFLDKNAYYELAIKAVKVVDKYLMAKGDYKGSAVVHNAISTWAVAIANQSSKRQSFKYFLLWARMEREVSTVEAMLLKKLKKRHDSDDDEDEETEKKASAASNDYLSAPIKMIYKQPSGTSSAAFREAAKQFLLAIFPNESLVRVTDDMTQTLPPVDVTAALGASKKVSKALRAQLKVANHCLLTVAEVEPIFVPVSAPTRHLDRPHTILRFEHVNRVGAATVTKAGGQMTKSQHVSTNLPKTQIDVMRQQLSVNVHFTERSFPSITSAITVNKSEEELLDPYETAVETIHAELDAVEESSSLALAPLLRCLTPMSVVPPGAYYKEVVSQMHSNEKVMEATRSVLKVCRARLAQCEENGEPIQKNPETYALILKGLADIECALIDYPPQPPSQQAPVPESAVPSNNNTANTSVMSSSSQVIEQGEEDK